MAFVKSTVALFLFGLISGVILDNCESKTIEALKESEGNFKLICNVTFKAGGVPVLKYRSSNSGMHVYIAQVDGPIVRGVFTLPTEASDDDGLPHTLEHLVFRGSNKYPYTSALDLLANWNNAGGTNAYTAVDHTAYSLNVAGKDGFLNILPVYLDHILNPLLKEESFVTEVYHITKEGKDSGVVYSEMQGRENSRSSLMYSALNDILYPSPSGYRYNTGGRMKNLRESTSYEKIKKYHKKFYRPEFLHLTVTGKTNQTELFEVLNSFEAEMTNEENDIVTKPWSTKSPPFSKSKDKKVLYPSQSEENASIMFAWRGPSAELILEIQCLQVLLMYLTSLSISPLTKSFTEERELANSVYGFVRTLHSSSIIIGMSGVKKENISEIKPHFVATLKNISSNSELFDLDLMETIIDSLITGQDNSLETDSHGIFISYINDDIRFGKDCDFLDKVLNLKKHYEEMKDRDASFWIELMNKYFIDTPMATVVGIPSKSEAKRIKEETKTRIAKRKLELGEEKLKKFGEIVKKSKKVNDVPLPASFLESFAVPSTENLQFHNLTPYTNIENHASGIIPAKFPKIFDLTSIPFKLSIDDINAKAVHITTIMDYSDLSASEYFYMPLLINLILSSPIQKNCELISSDDVIRQINSDLNHASVSGGVNMFTIRLKLKAEKKKFSKAVEWLNNFLFNLHFDVKRVSLKTNQLLTSYKTKKQSAGSRMTIIMNDLLLQNDTPPIAKNFLRQEKFLKDLKAKLKQDPSTVLDKLKEIYEKITPLNKLSIHMSTNIEELDSVRDVETTLKTLARNSNTCMKDFRLKDLANWMGMANFSDNSGKAVVHGMESLQSAYLNQVTTAINDYSDVNLPALFVAIKYFTQQEGPLWRGVRGNGLAYGCRISSDIGYGLLYLSIYRASQLTKAYEVAREIIHSHLNGSTKWEEHLLQTAKSSFIYALASSESDVTDLSSISMNSYYKKVPYYYYRELIRKVRKVTMEEVQAIAQKYLGKLVHPQDSLLVTVCPSGKVNETSQLLSRLKFNTEVLDSIETSRFA